MNESGLKKLKVLVIEDEEEDYRTLLRQIESAGYEAEANRVETEAELREALRHGIYDLVLADYLLPGFNAEDALRVYKATASDVPFVVVSGVIGEDVAVAMMKAGAHDYVLKGNLRRLQVVIERELREGNIRREHRLVSERARAQEKALGALGKRLSLALDFAKVAVWTWQVEGDKVIWSGPVDAVFGRTADELGSFHAFRKAIVPEDRDMVDERIAVAIREDHKYSAEFRIACPDGSVRWIAGEGDALVEEDGTVSQMAGVNFDISARKQAERQLETSERHFRELADAMPQIVWKSAANGDVEYYNKPWHDYSGLSFDDSKAWGWAPVVHKDDLQTVLDVCQRGFGGCNPFQVEARLKRAEDGSYRWHLSRAVPSFDHSGNLVGWFGAASDIHEQKVINERLEEQVLQRTSALQQSLHEIQAKENELLQLLAEKDVLLKEVHHRVKNNLQVVSSLLRMQASTLKDPAARAALQDSQRRVVSMALIHERLYGGRQVDQIDFAEYAKLLVSDLFSTYQRNKAPITSRFLTSPVFLSIDQAIPAGLILNELVTNALKYAYPSMRAGEIVVDLAEDSSGVVKLSVSDRGVGLPPGLDWKNSKSMGLLIVDTLTKQIGGELVLESSGPGATFSVFFPRKVIAMAAADGSGA